MAQLTAPDGKLSKANSNKPRAASYPQSSHGSGFAHSHHESFSAGDPGDPMKPARIVSAVMREANAKMLFVPDRLEIKKGEQIELVLRNNGDLDHEFLLATTAETSSMPKI